MHTNESSVPGPGFYERYCSRPTLYLFIAVVFFMTPVEVFFAFNRVFVHHGFSHMKIQFALWGAAIPWVLLALLFWASEIQGKLRNAKEYQSHTDIHVLVTAFVAVLVFGIWNPHIAPFTLCFGALLWLGVFLLTLIIIIEERREKKEFGKS